MIDEEFLEEQRRKAKETLEVQVKPLVAKGGIIAPISSVRPKSSVPAHKSAFENINRDLSFIINNKENAAHNCQIIPISEEEKL